VAEVPNAEQLLQDIVWLKRLAIERRDLDVAQHRHARPANNALTGARQAGMGAQVYFECGEATVFLEERNDGHRDSVTGDVSEEPLAYWRRESEECDQEV
jgi:hypothetical protein